LQIVKQRLLQAPYNAQPGATLVGQQQQQQQQQALIPTDKAAPMPVASLTQKGCAPDASALVLVICILLNSASGDAAHMLTAALHLY
jgi:hypothetical protein